MRKIRLLVEGLAAECALSSAAEARSRPNGFSMITRALCGAAGLAEAAPPPCRRPPAGWPDNKPGVVPHRAPCARLETSPRHCNRRPHSAAARTSFSNAAGSRPPCFSRLSFARALSWSRFQPALATPMTGTLRLPRFNHRLQRGENFLVGEIAGGAEKNQRVGMSCVHDCSSLGRFLQMSAESKAHRRKQLVLKIRLAA